jgi:hypothetical protein
MTVPQEMSGAEYLEVMVTLPSFWRNERVAQLRRQNLTR